MGAVCDRTSFGYLCVHRVHLQSDGLSTSHTQSSLILTIHAVLTVGALCERTVKTMFTSAPTVDHFYKLGHVPTEINDGFFSILLIRSRR